MSLWRIMIYLDNAGTTKMFDECVEIGRKYSCENFFNPSALSVEALEVSRLLNETEKFFLNELGALQGNVLFTGCATESNNLAVKGSLRTGDWEYVFSAGEHPSVYNQAKKLELDGCKVHIVPLNEKGQIDLQKLQSVLNEKTRLISVIHVSNETGAVNDLQKISQMKKKICPKAILHVDGVQAFKKIPFALAGLDVDLYSFSGHKLHAPKGIAGLYVKNKSALKELFYGGGQQYGLRSGTENVAGIMQFKKAVEKIDVKQNWDNVTLLKKQMVEKLSKVEGIEVFDFEGSVYILNLAFNGVKGETMLHALNEKGVIVGLGSACSSKKAGNRVLENIGLDKDLIVSSVRISFNAYQTLEEIEKASEIIVKVYKDIKDRVSS